MTKPSRAQRHGRTHEAKRLRVLEREGLEHVRFNSVFSGASRTWEPKPSNDLTQKCRVKNVTYFHVFSCIFPPFHMATKLGRNSFRSVNMHSLWMCCRFMLILLLLWPFFCGILNIPLATWQGEPGSHFIGIKLGASAFSPFSLLDCEINFIGIRLCCSVISFVSIISTKWMHQLPEMGKWALQNEAVLFSLDRFI